MLSCLAINFCSACPHYHRSPFRPTYHHLRRSHLISPGHAMPVLTPILMSPPARLRLIMLMLLIAFFRLLALLNRKRRRNTAICLLLRDFCHLLFYAPVAVLRRSQKMNGERQRSAQPASRMRSRVLRTSTLRRVIAAFIIPTPHRRGKYGSQTRTNRHRTKRVHMRREQK